MSGGETVSYGKNKTCSLGRIEELLGLACGEFLGREKT